MVVTMDIVGQQKWQVAIIKDAEITIKLGKWLQLGMQEL